MRTLLIFFLCLSISRVFSQDTLLLEQKIGWRGNQIEVHTISDEAKQQNCIVVANPDSIRVYWFDSSMVKKQQFIISRLMDEQILGGFIKEGKAYLFIQNPAAKKGLRISLLESATGKVTEKGILLDLKDDENIICTANCGSHFVYLTLNAKSAEFKVYDFASEEYSTISYQVDKDAWAKLLKTANLKKGLEISKIELEEECNINMAACADKIYCRNDTLLLLMNNVPKETNIYCFDLKNKKAGVKTIQHFPGFPTVTTDDVADNSFLFRDKLYYVRASYDSLGIQISNFYTGVEITAFKASVADSIPFSNTPVYNKTATETNVLSGPKKMLKKMLHDNPVIMALPVKNNQLAITVGSSENTSNKVQKSSSAVVPLPLFFIPGAGIAHMLVVPVGSTFHNVPVESAYFTMLINGSTGKHIPGQVPSSLYEKVDNYLYSMNTPPLGSSLFVINGRYHCAFYNKDGRKLAIWRF